MSATDDPGRDTGTPQEEKIMQTVIEEATPLPVAVEQAVAIPAPGIDREPIETAATAALRLARDMGAPPDIARRFGDLFREGREAAKARAATPPTFGTSVAREDPEEAAERRAAASEAMRRRRERSKAVLAERMPKRFHRPFPGEVPQAVRTWTADDDGCNLVTWGQGVGTGKSHLVWRIAQARADRGQWVVAWSMPMLNQAMRPDGDSGALEEAIACDVLLIDELGAEKVTEWTLERLTMILDARWGDEKPVIISTNLDPDHVAERYDERIADRIYDGAQTVELSGISHRQPPRG